MKSIYLLFFLFLNICIYSQCDIRTTERPDGHTINYFKPKPVSRQTEIETGLGLYYNATTKQYTLAVMALFTNGNASKQSGNLMIQTTGKAGLSLKPFTHEIVDMNGNSLATSIYLLTKKDIEELKKYNLKTISYMIGKKYIGVTVTENKNLLVNEFKCLSHDKVGR